MEIWNYVSCTLFDFAKHKSPHVKRPLSDWNERVWCLLSSFKWEYNSYNPGQFIQYLWAVQICLNAEEPEAVFYNSSSELAIFILE